MGSTLQEDDEDCVFSILRALVRAYGHEVTEPVLPEKAAKDAKPLNGSKVAKQTLARSLQSWLDMDAQTERLSLENLEYVTNMRYARYESGESSPATTTLAVFSELLPGSRVIYDFGMEYLPVWGVLAGKVGICKPFVDDVLRPNFGSVDIRFDEQVQRVFDELIAPAYRLKFYETPDFGLAQNAIHPVWLTHVNELMFIQQGDDPEETRRKDPELAERPVDEELIFIAIALWHVARDRGDDVVFRLEWLLMGLCYGVIAHHLGEEVQAIVLRTLLELGSVMKPAGLKKNPEGLGRFNDRWNTVIAIDKR